MIFNVADPEEVRILDHIWRKVCCVKYCKYTKQAFWESRDEWDLDVGYCLDRHSLIDSRLEWI